MLVDGRARRRSSGGAAHRSSAPRRPTAGAILGSVLLKGVARLGRGFRHAIGRPDDANLDRRLGVAVAVGLAAMLVQPLLVGPVVGLTWALPAMRQRARDRQQRERLVGEVPDLTELFRLAVGAGLTVHQAVAAVRVRAPADCAGALAEVAARVALGHRLADALDRLGSGDEAFRPLAAALASAERYGVALGPTLDRLADDARLQRRRRAEEVARRLPVQMLFPLVLCILPAFALLTVVPLMLTALSGLPR
jgi:tight adherence protein C